MKQQWEKFARIIVTTAFLLVAVLFLWSGVSARADVPLTPFPGPLATLSSTPVNISALSGIFVLKAGDTMTGALDTPTLTTQGVAGAPSIFNETGVDADFRVESDTNTHMLFVDASANVVGIGTSTPVYDLDVLANSNTAGASSIALQNLANGNVSSSTFLLFNQDKSVNAQYSLQNGAFTTSGLLLADQLGIGSNGNGGVLIYASANTGAPIVFSTGFDGGTSINNERMRITGTEVSVNDFSQSVDFRVESDTQTHMLFVDGSANAIGIGTSTPTTSTVDVRVPLLGEQTSTLTSAYWQLPRSVSTATPTMPACTVDGDAGKMVYVDDTDDAVDGTECTCKRVAGVYGWKITGTTTACPFL